MVIKPQDNSATVLRVADIDNDSISRLLQRYDLTAEFLPEGATITASFWGAPEAGIVGKQVFVRPDTPVHSLLHEACHVICMTAERRASLYRDAGGDDPEESAVCYLQIILANFLSGVGAQRLIQDMDDWGYSFRLGSTALWFSDDAADARNWLLQQGLLGADDQPIFRLRS